MLKLLSIIISLISITTTMAQSSESNWSKMKTMALCLKPHQDLKKELMAFAAKEKIKAGCIVTCVGSLEQINLRFANQPEGKRSKGHFEILSLEMVIGELTDLEFERELDSTNGYQELKVKKRKK
jgi:uncharacterized protein